MAYTKTHESRGRGSSRWFGEYDPASGKQRRYSKSFRLKVEAEEFQAIKRQEIDQGTPRDRAPDVSLSSFLKDWLSARRPELRPASVELYRQTIKRLLVYFGKDTHLKDITPKKAAVFLSEQKSRAIGHQGKELSEWSREQIKRHCKTIFETAAEWRLIPTNPFKSLRLKKPGTKRWHRLTVQEYQDLLEAAPTLRWKAFYALAFTSGARMGELFSLTWNDIDFENGRLIISDREGTTTTPPFHIKDHEARRVPLPAHTIDLLTQFHAKAPEGVPYILLDEKRYERVKAKWQELWKAGKPWLNRYMVNNVLRDFKKHCKKAGIKPVGKLTIHTLRKSCGQNWADYLPMNVVKELMGHSKVETTLEFYNQVDRDHEAKAARVIQRLIGNANGDNRSNKTDARLTPDGISRQFGGDK